MTRGDTLVSEQQESRFCVEKTKLLQLFCLVILFLSSPSVAAIIAVCLLSWLHHYKCLLWFKKQHLVEGHRWATSAQVTDVLLDHTNSTCSPLLPLTAKVNRVKPQWNKWDEIIIKWLLLQDKRFLFCFFESESCGEMEQEKVIEIHQRGGNEVCPILRRHKKTGTGKVKEMCREMAMN